MEGSGARREEPVWRLAPVLYDHVTTKKRTWAPAGPGLCGPLPQPGEHSCSWVQARTMHWGSKEGQRCGDAEAGETAAGGRGAEKTTPPHHQRQTLTRQTRAVAGRDSSSAHLRLTES